MKRTTLIAVTLLILALTACSGASTAGSPASGSQSALPAATQLAIGTLKLEGTEQAVSAEQAAELLPLWQTLQVLYDSDTAAEQEFEALTTQIQETMTSDQMQAIADMNLTPQDILAVMQEQGIEFGSAQRSAQGNNAQNNAGGGFPAGGPPDGDVPGGGPGGFGPGGGQNLSPEQIATVQARRAENAGAGFGGSNTIPAPLIQAMIEWLQEKAGS